MSRAILPVGGRCPCRSCQGTSAAAIAALPPLAAPWWWQMSAQERAAYEGMTGVVRARELPKGSPAPEGFVRVRPGRKTRATAVSRVFRAGDS